MYLALMLKLCRAEKPDTEEPGQKTSWLEAFSRTPALKVALHPGHAHLDVVQQGRAPVRLPDVVLWELLLDIWRLVVRRTRLYVLLETWHIPRAPCFSFATRLSCKCLPLPNLLALTHTVSARNICRCKHGDNLSLMHYVKVHLRHALLSTNFVE